MLRLHVHNRLLGWDDPVANARIYVDPTTKVYPPPTIPPAADATTNKWGRADLNLSGLSPSNGHKLWIVPEHTTDAPVGPSTAKAVPGDPDRIYRGLEVSLHVRKVGTEIRAQTANVWTVDQQKNGEVRLTGTDQTTQNLDVRLQPIWIKSPYTAGRGTSPIDMIVVHRTGGDAIGNAINQFLSGGTSIHYIVDKNGSVVKMCLDARRSYQAGKHTHWGSHTGINSRSIGIENVNGSGKFRLSQTMSLLRLLKDLKAEHNIAPERIVGHSDVRTDASGELSNGRIACPGSKFNWPTLEDDGFGLKRSGGPAQDLDKFGGFFDLAEADGVSHPALRENDKDSSNKFGGKVYSSVTGNPIADLQTYLREIGYSVGSSTGTYNHRTARAVLHLQTRFFAGGHGHKTPDAVVDRKTAELILAVWSSNPHAP